MNKTEQLRNDWEALCSADKRKRALELLNEGFSKRGLAKALNISEAALRYYVNVKEEKADSARPKFAAQSASPGDTAIPSAPEGFTRPALNPDTRPAAKPSTSAKLIEFVKNADLESSARHAAADRRQEVEVARIDDLIRAFAGFLTQKWSLEPIPCLQLLRLILARLNEAELSRHLPRPLPADTDARRVLARLRPRSPHDEDFEQVIYCMVVGLLYLGETPAMRRQVLCGLDRLFRSEIEGAKSCAH